MNPYPDINEKYAFSCPRLPGRDLYGIKEAAREEGLEEGRQQGREEGREQGREEGKKLGMEEGGREVALDMASRMKQKGMDTAYIAELTGLEPREVEGL